MNEILASMQLCGLLPCLAGDQTALRESMEALVSFGFPCVEADLTSDSPEPGIWDVFALKAGIHIGAKVRTKDQARKALAAGARWVTLPAAEGMELGHPAPVFSIVKDTREAREILTKGEGFLCSEAQCAQALLDQFPKARFVISGCTDVMQRKKFLSLPQVLAALGTLPADAKHTKDQTESLRREWMEILGFSLVHIGINGKSVQEAEETARTFSRLLGMPYLPGTSSDYAGTIIEAMKEKGRGQNGHIGIGTDDLKRGMYYAQRAGFSFDLSSRKNDASGRAILYYLDREIAGFAVHFLQK